MAQRKFIIDGGFKTDDASELLANLTMGGTIDMDGDKVLNLGTPTADTDAATKAYVDTAASQAETDATTAAAAANSSLETSLQSYADTAEADAIATAAADATSKANTAESNANTYTDTAVSNLVDSSPDALNTLNELAAALGDDANYAASVTSAIATSLQSAKDYADANDANTTYTAGNGLSLSGTEFLMSGSYSGSFTATGDITAYSDDTLKTNVQVIDGALGKVEAIRGVTFERIEDGSVSTGVIAQELKEVLPEAVHTDANGVHSVAYGNITGLLIEAVKELSAQVEALKK